MPEPEFTLTRRAAFWSMIYSELLEIEREIVLEETPGDEDAANTAVSHLARAVPWRDGQWPAKDVEFPATFTRSDLEFCVPHLTRRIQLSEAVGELDAVDVAREAITEFTAALEE